MQWTSSDSTQKQRDRARLAADIEEFLNRGGRIEHVEVLPRPLVGGIQQSGNRVVGKDELDLDDTEA